MAQAERDVAVACGATMLLKERPGVDGPASGHHEFVATCTRLAGHEGEHEHYTIGGSVRWESRAAMSTDGEGSS